MARDGVVQVGGLAIALAAALSIGAGAGWWLGRSSAPVFEVEAGACEASAVPASPDPLAAASGRDDLAGAFELSLLDNLRLAARVGSLESLLTELEAQDVPPREIVRQVVAQLDERELQATIGATTGLRDFEVERIEDWRAFAVRLADVALEGFVEEADPGDEERDDESMAPIYFATERVKEDPESVARTTFSAAEPRIYALFSTDHSRVTVRWARVDRPRLMSVRRSTVSRSPRYGWVAMEPPEGWEAGTYQVSVYTGDEQLTPLARGEYVIR